MLYGWNAYCTYLSMFTLLLILLANSIAAVADPTPASLQSASLVVVQQLLKSGVHKIGDLDLADLSTELKQVRWEINSSGLTYAGSGKARTGAIYLVDKKTVIINSNTPVSEGVMPTNALHEGLGALGYVDENYELSLAMTLKLAMLQGHEDISKLSILDDNFKNLKKRQENEIYRMAGGGTSVGGGGDPTALEAKLIVGLHISNLLQSQKTQVTKNLLLQEALRKLIATEFENNTDPLAQNTKIEQKDGSTIVLIPMAQWIWTALHPNSPLSAQKRATLLRPVVSHFLSGLESYEQANNGCKNTD